MLRRHALEAHRQVLDQRDRQRLGQRRPQRLVAVQVRAGARERRQPPEQRAGEDVAALDVGPRVREPLDHRHRRLAGDGGAVDRARPTSRRRGPGRSRARSARAASRPRSRRAARHRPARRHPCPDRSGSASAVARPAAWRQAEEVDRRLPGCADLGSAARARCGSRASAAPRRGRRAGARGRRTARAGSSWPRPDGPLDLLERAADARCSATRPRSRAGTCGPEPDVAGAGAALGPRDGQRPEQRRERLDPGVAVLVDRVAEHLADAGADRGIGVVAVLRARDAVVSRSRSVASAPLQSSSIPLSGTSTAPGRIAGLASLQSAGRRTPSRSASPSICSHEIRASASSEIAVSLPAPQVICSARPSRATMLSSPEPPSKTSIPPPPKSPSLPAPPLRTTVIVSAGLIAATSSSASRLRIDARDAGLGADHRSVPRRRRCSQAPARSSTPPKRVKRTLSPVSNAAIWSIRRRRRCRSIVEPTTSRRRRWHGRRRAQQRSRRRQDSARLTRRPLRVPGSVHTTAAPGTRRSGRPCRCRCARRARRRRPDGDRRALLERSRARRGTLRAADRRRSRRRSASVFLNAHLRPGSETSRALGALRTSSGAPVTTYPPTPIAE